MNSTEAALLASVLVNFVSLYGAFRKTRTEATSAAARAEEETEATVIARWQAYAVEQEAARQRDAARLEAEIAELRADNVECRERAARQEERIEHLTGDVRQLRADLKRAGIRPGTSDHDPLKEIRP